MLASLGLGVQSKIKRVSFKEQHSLEERMIMWGKLLNGNIDGSLVGVIVEGIDDVTRWPHSYMSQILLAQGNRSHGIVAYAPLKTTPRLQNQHKPRRQQHYSQYERLYGRTPQTLQRIGQFSLFPDLPGKCVLTLLHAGHSNRVLSSSERAKVIHCYALVSILSTVNIPCNPFSVRKNKKANRIAIIVSCCRYVSSFARRSLQLHRLKTLTVPQIKELISLSDALAGPILRKILKLRTENTPYADLANTGLIKSHQANQFYLKKVYHYEGPDSHKRKIAAETLMDQLTLTRIKPLTLGIRRNFILSGLEDCLKTLTNGQIFRNTIEDEYPWFRPDLSSIALWIAHFIQCRILEAKKIKQNFQRLPKLTFIRENIDQTLRNKLIMEAALTLISDKTERDFVISQSTVRLSQANDPEQMLVEYLIAQEDPSSNFHLIMATVASKVDSLYEEHKINLLTALIEGPANSRKKKKNKKKTDKKQPQHIKNNLHQMGNSVTKPSNGLIQPVHEGTKNKTEIQQPLQLIQNPGQSNKNMPILEDENTSDVLISTAQIKTTPSEADHAHETDDPKSGSVKQPSRSSTDVGSREEQSFSIVLNTKLESEVEDKSHQEGPPEDFIGFQEQLHPRSSSSPVKRPQQHNQELNSLKANIKAVNSRISECLNFFSADLAESSNSFSKFRRQAFALVQKTLKDGFPGLRLKLQLFGSCATGFTLKQSDIDVLIWTQSSVFLSLEQIFRVFSTKKWVIECQNLTTAKNPIVSMQIDLTKTDLINSKELKKIVGNMISVDLCVCQIGHEHEGIKTTHFLNETLRSYPTLLSTSLILKELLRVCQLNKPRYGGIGSYVLVLLTNNILRSKGLICHEDIYTQLLAICRFMELEFVPFETVIGGSNRIIADSSKALNIYDKEMGQIAQIYAYRVFEVCSILRSLGQFLTQLQDELLQMNIEEKKKIKKHCLSRINRFFESVQVTQ